jgi:predicted O-methyltransferase YrrM
MSTPHNNHSRTLLDRLFAEADAATSPAIKSFTTEERIALTASKTEYLDLYGRLKDLWSRETGELLYMLVRATGARTVVEFGTSFGISSLYIAAGLRDNGGGRLRTRQDRAGTAKP